jgi:hypothetical protein
VDPATTSTRTLQSPAPLRRLPTNAGTELIVHVATYPALLLDPPYQRGSVWGAERQRLLIRSLLQGVPVGNVFLNVRPDPSMTVAVVDGRQRLETVLAFTGGRLAVPASWFDPTEVTATEATADGLYVRWGGLTTRGRARLDRATVVTQRTDLATAEEEAELFRVVNYGGVAQGDHDDDRTPGASPCPTCASEVRSDRRMVEGLLCHDKWHRERTDLPPMEIGATHRTHRQEGLTPGPATFIGRRPPF